MIVRFAPLVGLCAAVTFTSLCLLGYYPFVRPWQLILFDAVNLLYGLVSVFYARRGVIRNGVYNAKALRSAQSVLILLTILQWNLISYIFPAADFWGFAALFVLLNLSFFDSRLVLVSITGLTVSLLASWLISGELLLPSRAAYYTENLILRCVGLVLTFLCLYSTARYGERFRSAADENQRTLVLRNRELEQLNSDTIRFTADLIDRRDNMSGEHVRRVESYTRLLARTVMLRCPEYALTETDVDSISRAALLHDIGKIGVPDSILLKAGTMTDEEKEIMHRHTYIGADIVSRMPSSGNDTFRRYCRDICLYHHERWDGSGYPNGFKGDDIPVCAQIVAVADCYDALTSIRPYKKAIAPSEAARMITQGECGAFSEKLLDCFRECLPDFESVSR